VVGIGRERGSVMPGHAIPSDTANREVIRTPTRFGSLYGQLTKPNLGDTP